MSAVPYLGLVRGSFGFAPTSGFDKSPSIWPFEFGGCAFVCCAIAICVMFALFELGVARGSFGLAPTYGSVQAP